ncbi:S-layer homology domain-containing protein [Paenibacillus sp. M1]|uniref:S-layer homology domain-containing protein n=1 Tax=Paenibacillus haidiansis TaxID=1574488 RepID=A0ABU7W0B9_9BACL
MKQSLSKIAISTTLSLGLAVSGISPVLPAMAESISYTEWTDNSPFVIAPIIEDQPDIPEILVSSLLDGKVQNPEVTGIAVVSTGDAGGTWQYYNTGNGLWYSISSASDANAFLLKSTDKLKFVPAQDWNGKAVLTMKLWDISELHNYTYVDTSAYPGLFSDTTGTAEITVTPENDAPYLTDEKGGAYIGFDGSGDYLSVPAFPLYNDSFTIEGYLKIDRYNQWMRFFESSDGANSSNIFVGFDRGMMNFSAYVGAIIPIGSNNITTSATFPLNKWVHVAAVYDGSGKQGYIYWNGELMAKGPMDISSSSTSRSNNWLGRSSWAQDLYYAGGMRDVRYWSTARSQNDIVRDMNADLTGSEAGLVADYKLNEPIDSNIAVSTPEGKDGSLVGNTWKQDAGFIGSTTTYKNRSAARSFKVYDIDNADINVTAVSSNPALISNDNLVITGSGEQRTLTMTPSPNAVGSAEITVTVDDRELIYSSSFRLVVIDEGESIVSGVILDSDTLDLTVDGPGQTLNATVLPEDAANQNVSWASSDASVASVDGNGFVTPVGPGVATITVTTSNGNYTASATVNVAAKPDAPTAVTAIPGDGEATVNFTAPDHDGNGPITEYTVIASPGGIQATGTGSPITVTGLDNGTEYTFTVIATNRAGDSAASAPSNIAIPRPPAPGAPVMKAPVAGNGQVALSWEGVDDATGYKVFQSETPDAFETEVTTVTGSVYEYTVTGLTNGTTYYFVVKATNLGSDSEASLPVSATPVTVPGVPADVRAVAGNGKATITFTPPTDNGGSPITGYEVTALPGGMTVTGTGSPITVTGLTNGTSYTFTVRAINGVGGSEVSAESAAVTPRSPSSGGGGSSSSSSSSSSTSTPVITPPAAPQAPDNSVDILINGKAGSAGTVATSTRNGQSVTTVTLDQHKLADTLAAEGRNAVITIPVVTESDIVIGVLNGQMVKNMADNETVLEIKTDRATYTLPARQINIDSVSRQIGESVALQDITVQIEIAEPAADTIQIVADAAVKGSFTVVAPPVDFTIRGIYGDQTIEVTKFNSYVERLLAIPDGIDPSKITTGVVVEPDGTVRHVPTKVVVIDGSYYAKINSLTNSTYTVIWHPLEFSDVVNHWAKDAVNDMGSRMVVDGVGDNLFDPNTNITRAEFAAIVVRGLGLKLGDGETAFSDIRATDWYSGAIETAYEYELINGFEDGSFRPNEQITREQAMAIIAKAMKVTTLADKLPDQTANDTLLPYADAEVAANWALESIAHCLQAGIVTGRSSSELAPKSNITRAEVAAIVQRLLQKSDLI